MGRTYNKVMNKIQTASRIEGITGDALAILFELGASPDLVGQFAVRFPNKVAARVGPVEQILVQPELSTEELIQRTVELTLKKASEVRSAVIQESSKVVVKVRTLDKNTSVSIPKVLIDKISNLRGGTRGCNKLIKNLYLACPDAAPSKAGWIVEELIKLVGSE